MSLSCSRSKASFCVRMEVPSLVCHWDTFDILAAVFPVVPFRSFPIEDPFTQATGSLQPGRLSPRGPFPPPIGHSERLRQYVNTTLSEATHIHAVSRPGYFHPSRWRARLHLCALQNTRKWLIFLSPELNMQISEKVINSRIYSLRLGFEVLKCF